MEIEKKDLALFSAMKENLKKLIGIPSVKSEPVGNAPFGESVKEALLFTLSLAEELGFHTVNYDNYIGEAVYGDGEDEMAILCHLDVVPVGKLSDWKYPPFSATEADGKIYGRGATDDKGPAIVCLYCMKALKDEGYLPGKKIKLIFGCDEESGWGCIEHYKKVAKMPDFGFSPDADFPVLYAEKGILHVKFFFDAEPGLKELKGGERVNVVCDRCVSISPLNDNFASNERVKKEGDELVSYGISAHGSMPEKGKNAILPMIELLAENGLADKRIAETLFYDCYGLKELEDETGKLTMSPDVIDLKNGKIEISVDIRYPSTVPFEKVKEKIDRIAPYEILSHQLPLFNDKNSFLVQTLLKIYNDAMGTNMQPMAIGGGTYARALKEGTAFGPEMPGEESTVHQPNEYVSVENLKLQWILYKKAIRKLSE